MGVLPCNSAKEANRSRPLHLGKTGPEAWKESRHSPGKGEQRPERRPRAPQLNALATSATRAAPFADTSPSVLTKLGCVIPEPRKV